MLGYLIFYKPHHIHAGHNTARCATADYAYFRPKHEKVPKRGIVEVAAVVDLLEQAAISVPD